MFFSTIRQALREKRIAIAERDFQRLRADNADAEAEHLRIRLSKRTEFFVEKEKYITERDRAKKAEAEVERLQEKLEKRSDFFVEREFALMDRFLTSQVKTYAITDEIKHKEEALKYDAEARDAALEAHLRDKREFLEHCARETGRDDWKDMAAVTFKENYSQYVLEFDQKA